MNKTKREEKALQGFKSLMKDLVLLLGKATGAETGYLYWVNRNRRQFVLETTHTSFPNIMFADRVPFEKSFLSPYKDLKKMVQLQVGKEISENQLEHYFDRVPVRHLLLIPFRNNDETVAISVLETAEKLSLQTHEDSLFAYTNSYINVLNTYLELTDLYEDQTIWSAFDHSLEKFRTKMTVSEVFKCVLREMQKRLPGGGAVAALRGMGTWVAMLQSDQKAPLHSIGVLVDDRTLAYEALNKGEAVFSIHFNQNPKRFSLSENQTEGASLAIPLMINERRYAVFVANSNNPLIFTESLQHQLKTLVKIASLTLEVSEAKKENPSDLLVSEFGSFHADLLELSLEQVTHPDSGREEHLWFGLVGIENLTEIRSRYRLDDLKKMQANLVKALNPARTGYRGFIGYHSDYVYSYLFISRSEHHHREWMNKTISDIQSAFTIGEGKPGNVDIKFGSVAIRPGNTDVQQLIRDAKKALSFALKEDVSAVNM